MTSPRCRCRRFRSAASRPDRLVVPAAGRQPHDSMMGICRPAASTTKCHAIRESLWWEPTLVGTVPATSRSDRWCQPRLAPANSGRYRRFQSAASRPDRLVVPAAGRQPHDSMVGICRPAAGTTQCHAIRESLWWVPTLVGTVQAASRSDRWCQPRLAPANSERCRRFRSAASRPDRLVVPAAGRQPHDSMVGICRPAAGTTKCHAIRESLWWVPTLVGTVPATSRSDRWCQPRLAPANSERCRRFRSGASRPDRLVVPAAGRQHHNPMGGICRPAAGTTKCEAVRNAGFRPQVLAGELNGGRTRSRWKK